jgi:hypothetical protein
MTMTQKKMIAVQATIPLFQILIYSPLPLRIISLSISKDKEFLV